MGDGMSSILLAIAALHAIFYVPVVLSSSPSTSARNIVEYSTVAWARFAATACDIQRGRVKELRNPDMHEVLTRTRERERGDVLRSLPVLVCHRAQRATDACELLIRAAGAWSIG